MNFDRMAALEGALRTKGWLRLALCVPDAAVEARNEGASTTFEAAVVITLGHEVLRGDERLNATVTQPPRPARATAPATETGRRRRTRPSRADRWDYVSESSEMQRFVIQIGPLPP
jgi:hypothetical protein